MKCIVAYFVWSAFAFSHLGGQSEGEARRPIWESIYFFPIDDVSTHSPWMRLRNVEFAVETTEIRLWILPSFASVEGYMIRRTGAKWMAQTVSSRFDADGRVTVQDLKPKGDWEGLWQRLIDEGILTLPDSSTLAGGRHMFDGVSYVVEVHSTGSYRTYHYENPEDQTWPEAKHLLAIVAAIKTELVKVAEEAEPGATDNPDDAQ